MIVPRIISVVALFSYVVLLFLIRGNLRRREVRSFALYLVAMLIWQAGVTGATFASDPMVALNFYKVALGLGFSFGVFYAQFSRDFLGVRAHAWIIGVGYALVAFIGSWTLLGGAGVILEVYQSPGSSLLLPAFGSLVYVSAGITYCYLVYSAIILVVHHQRATTQLVRGRIRYLLLGLLLVFLGTLANLSTTLKPYPIDMVMNALNAFLIAYAMFRYQLLDISVIIRKGLLYSLLTAIIGAVYFLGVFLALSLFHLVTGYQILLLSLFLAAVTAVAMLPLRDVMQAWLDKLFFREKYDAGLMLKRLSRTAASVLQLDRLTDMILDDVLATMHVSSGAFFIMDEKGGDYRLRAYKGSGPAPEGLSSFRPDSPLISWLSEHQTSLSSRVLEIDPSFIGLWARERDDLKRLRAELFVPLLAAGKLIGVLALGAKLSESSFTSEEQLILDTLANQTAVAIENARLFSMTVAEKERTAAIVEQAFAGIILLDSQLKIVSLNPAAEAIVGIDHTRAIGASLSEVLGRNILGERSSLRKAMATGQRVAPREEMLAVGDCRRDVLLGVTPLRDGYLLSLADITQLKEVDRLKSDIVANVSHEFRTPLAIIKAYAELLMDDQEGATAASRHEFLSIIDAETDRLAGMVSGLLDLARLESGRATIVMASVCIDEIVEEAVGLLAQQARMRSIAVHVDVPSSLPALWGNRELLVTLLRNLLSNAIKFSRDGGTVDVAASQAGDALVLQIADHGIGIAEDDMEHLFQKFYRGSTAKEARIRGTGLGLVLTKEAVEAHGGKIAVESQRGHGTCFTIKLPFSSSSGSVGEAEPAYPDSGSDSEELFTDLPLPLAAVSTTGE